MSQIDLPPHELEAPTEIGWATAAALAAICLIWALLAGPWLSPMALFLPLALPIGVWVAWNDMAHMKIPNAAAMILLLGFGVIGLFAFPLVDYAWRWSHFAIFLLVGFVMNQARLIGAGDAKFFAAMAPLLAFEDTPIIVRLFAALLLGAFVAHRTAKMIPAIRRLVPHWESWSRSDFPMGLTLGGLLMAYVISKALYGA